MRRAGGRKAMSAVVVALTVLNGCGGEDSPEGAAPAPSSTSSAAPPTSPPAPSTTAAGGGCPADDPVPPEGAEDVSEVSADVDGDGADDVVLAYRRGDGVRRVAVELAAGGTAAVDASASPVEGPAPLSVLGGVDLGGDGETVLALTGAGASVVIVGLFQFVECAISRVTFPTGQDVELPLNGGITHGDGIACAEQTLIARRATSTDGESFDVMDTTYRVDGNTLIEVGSETGTLTRAGDSEEINDYYTVDCPALENPPGDL